MVNINTVREVLIEQTEKVLTWTNPVILLHNHDYTKPIGKAWIHEDEGQYIADIDHLTVDPRNLYPSIGYRNIEGRLIILNVALCDNPNEDEKIFPIGNGNGEVKYYNT